jgi:hypothetical protein
MEFLRDTRKVAIREGGRNIFAGMCIVGDLDDDVIAQRQHIARSEASQVDTDERYSLADRTRMDRMALSLEREDHLKRIQADSALRSTMHAAVALPITFEAL